MWKKHVEILFLIIGIEDRMGYKYKTIDGQGNGGGCGKCLCVCSFSRVAKCCVFIINTIIMINGVTLIGLGTLIKGLTKEADPNYEMKQQAGWIIVGVGIWFFVVSAFGYMSLCCLKKNKCYIVLSALLLASLLTFPIRGAYHLVTEECDNEKSNPSNASFEEYYYPGNDFAKNLDRVQTLNQCCGLKGVNDYIDVSFNTEFVVDKVVYYDTFVPSTCCHNNTEYVEPDEEAISECQKEAHDYMNGNTSHSFQYLNTMGCLQSIRESCSMGKSVAIVVSSGLAFLEILGILLYIGLWRDARSRQIDSL